MKITPYAFGFIILGLIAVGSPLGAADGPAQGGTITGQVTNAGTGAYLEAAQVKITPGGQTTLTVREGQFTFPAVPPGVVSGGSRPRVSGVAGWARSALCPQLCDRILHQEDLDAAARWSRMVYTIASNFIYPSQRHSKPG